MNLKKIVLSIICFIGLIGIFGCLFYGLIVLIGIQLNGIIYFIEPNPLILTIELITTISGILIFPIIVVAITKYIDKK